MLAVAALDDLNGPPFGNDRLAQRALVADIGAIGKAILVQMIEHVALETFVIDVAAWLGQPLRRFALVRQEKVVHMEQLRAINAAKEPPQRALARAAAPVDGHARAALFTQQRVDGRKHGQRTQTLV